MKRTLVERVAEYLWVEFSGFGSWEEWKYEARRIIAMVRRHDRKEKGK